MTEFLTFQSIVNYRIPIVDGKPGTPEIVSKWTTEPKKKRVKKVNLKAEKPEERYV